MNTDEITIDMLIASGYLQPEEAKSPLSVMLASLDWQHDHDDLSDDDWNLFNG